MQINKYANEHYLWLQSVGWDQATLLESLVLVASEVGEAANECRGKTDTNKLGLELADIILRIFGISGKYGFDIESNIKKNAKNTELESDSTLECLSYPIIYLGKATESAFFKDYNKVQDYLEKIVAIIFLISKMQNIDIEKAVKDKMDINFKRGTRGRLK